MAMSRICSQCQAAVDDGKPFCPQCNAPMVRVSVEAETPPNPRPAATVNEERPSIRWSSALPKCLASGIASIFILTILALIAEPLALLAVPIMSAFTVWWYGRGERISAGVGARLGAMTGFACFLVNTILAVAQFTANRAGFVNLMRETMDRSLAREPNPQTKEMVHKMLESPENVITLLAVVSVIILIIFLVLGVAGGALAGAGKRPSPGDSA
ncbi:MAG: zinc ribbon domain-containing protein [Acidobacteriales bacterium]|nr:zinc ribbon domain-containing protein [Terriglobales bacterium]